MLLLVTALLLAAWCAYWARRAPAVAWTGIVVAALAHTVWLAIEFIACWRVNRRHAAPPRLAALLRAWAAESRMAVRVFGWRQPFRANAVPDHLPRGDGRRGVVFVHGFCCNRGFWTPWLSALRREGRAFVAVNLEPPFGSIDRYVDTIEAAVQCVRGATGQAPMLVCHSMGGLAARAWLREHGRSGAVHRIVTLGTPHAGTWLARFGRSTNGREMRIGGEWLQRMAEDTESVRRVPFTCWYSNCDNIVFPTPTATLPGADNRPVHGLAHVEMAFDTRVMRETLALLDLDQGPRCTPAPRRIT
ncbi:MAG: alpha/beta fold hydrolase [Rhodocyclaceae bacterium]|nr:alpha/beta fold hydrolase [Pseudomonadota bacterium]MDQ7974710.1 alpha/beta fold hydrolase [Rhodocyclaceae bacterium]MDQ8019584.1 alpha/beta fold hydrolase [Pseudomonadota bacterium]